MSVIFVLFTGLMLVLLGFHLFKRLINPLSLYVGLWAGMVALYEMKLIKYVDLSFDTWIILIFSTFSYVCGTVIVFAARSAVKKDNDIFKNIKIVYPEKFKNEWIIIAVMMLFTLIGLIAAYQHWNFILTKYDSIPKALIHATDLYWMRVRGQITGITPYLNAFAFAATFLAGIYTAFKNKFTIWGVIPILGLLVKELANMGRMGIVTAFLQFMVPFFIIRYLLNNDKSSKRGRVSKQIVVGAILIGSLLVGATAAVKSFRNPIENFTGTSRGLKEFSDNAFISPHVYLYLSSHVGVFSKYLVTEKETAKFGEHTFLWAHNFLAKFDFIDPPHKYQRGYYVPMWTNTGTYLREVHADFGITGVYLIPFLMALIITTYWFKFFEQQHITSLIVLTYFFINIGFCQVTLLSRSANLLLSFVLIAILAPFLEKYAFGKTENKNV